MNHKRIHDQIIARGKSRGLPGHKPSEATRIKMGNSHRGLTYSNKGKSRMPMREETKQKLRKPKQNKANYKGFQGTHTESTKLKIKQSVLATIQSKKDNLA